MREMTSASVTISDPHGNNVNKQRTILVSLLLVVAGTVAVYLPSSELIRFSGVRSSRRDSLQLDEDEMQYDAEISRFLMQRSLDDIDDFYKELAMPNWLRQATTEATETNLEDAMAAAIAKGHHDNIIGWGSRPVPNLHPLNPYSIEDVVESTSAFWNTVAIILYDPEIDQFLFLYNHRWHNWVSGCIKLKVSFTNFAFMLRQVFPERFQGKDSPELAIAISSGDFPHLSAKCLASFPHTSTRCTQKDAPLLQFGSAFRSSEILPNMIAMPFPEAHGMRCFKQWTKDGSVCNPFLEAKKRGGEGLVFDSTPSGMKFEDLIPQVVWRGTDYNFLPGILTQLRAPRPKPDIVDKIDPTGNTEITERKSVAALRDMYDSLLPRWKGVVLTDEAEVEAEEQNEQETGQHDVLPWCNIKFTGPGFMANDEKKASYAQFEGYGISTMGEHMSLEELANFKYHIDIGGGGGTTWSGTVQKLAMPGLLFHHETPTKDYIHYRMKPWIHYVPVSPDLKDLREKYDWAESNPEAARMIANQGSDLMRRLGTKEGMGKMVEEDFVDQVRRVIEAYQPVSTTHPGSTWSQVLKDVVGDDMSTIWQCTGNSAHAGTSCEKLEKMAGMGHFSWMNKKL